MDWHHHFEDIFFNTWRKAGLPAPDEFDIGSIDITAFGSFNSDWIINGANLPPGLQTYQLTSVYSFGVMLGVMFSRLLGLDTTQTKKAADWCGRFNLGISLFDYISDDLGGVSSMLALKVLQPFSASAGSLNSSATPAEELLGKLVSSVLDDLEKTSAKQKLSIKKDPLFKLLQQLYGAENFVTNEKLSATTDSKKVKQALYLKSAAPFMVMAEYTARMASPYNPELTTKARAIGKAVGCCYWMIDDAKDVWSDLAAGQWNLFLQLAAAKDPQLFAEGPGEFTNEWLMGIWRDAKHAEKISFQVIRQIINALNKLHPPAKDRQDALGFLAASMWQWYQS